MNKTRFKKLNVSIAALCLGLALSSTSWAKTANCQVEEGGKLSFKGQCEFILHENGSFSLQNADSTKALLREIMSLNVDITQPNVAEVSDSLTYGNYTQWGAAQRSKTDKSCWVGNDFRICARATK
ncbi:hypothetical protein [Acinetobacter larvae]|uniref:DUF3757 domain-containing protein n=1 Tax=Acinetobacter larvae TaxID=1789224 RepID=A0A1B2M2V6_9GAMM|nr:hypothetical protein [Acinetobacter larvae]AOA59522.1 hypothetical protein BFG52_14980 [Acinetobacter larvae]